MDPAWPREKAELVALCSLPGATYRRVRDLLTLFGSPAGAWDAVRAGRAGGRASPEPVSRWREMALERDPETEFESMEEGGISAVVRGEPGYPAMLDEVSDAPWVLFYRGRLVGQAVSVAVVGSRKATPYGLEVARWLSRELALRGVNVVSGAAYGIDSAAHSGALEGGGFTTAVLGCGVDVAYPRSNSSLFRRIAKDGCILSEYTSGTPPARHRFPERNRIIAGVSRAVVVVEASEDSGAFITVDFALAQGREIFAVPGQLFSPSSRGANALIKSGASLVTGPADILAELGLDAPVTGMPVRPPVSTPAHPSEEKLALAMAGGISQLEGLSKEAGLTTAEALAVLSRMEVSGAVVRGPGGNYYPVAT